jgi:hypothetical protein
VNTQDVSWLTKSQFVEKDLGHIFIEMLTGMYHHLVKVAAGSEGLTDRSGLDELRPRTDYG